jgi:Flp pilus assembly protein TadB
MKNSQPVQTPAAPAGEEIHLPGHSALPLASAIGITLIVIGLGLSLIIAAVGVLILVPCLVRWIGDSRRSLSELPESHE